MKMSDVPKLVRDVRVVVPTRSLASKVVVLCGAALVSLGTFAPPPANAVSDSRPTVITVAAPSIQSVPGPLVLSQQDQVGLLAQHRSHASHASHASHSSHYSGVTGGSAPAAPATPNTDSTKNENAVPKDTPRANVPNAVPSASIATVTSLPDLAEIQVDGKFAGNTKSALSLPPGQHEITIKKNGYEPWTRTIEVTDGSNVTVHADLIPIKKAARKTPPSKK